MAQSRHAIHARRLAHLLDGWRPGPGTIPDRLAQAVTRLVVDGRVPVRCRLPSERELAAAVGVSRSTVTAAYAQLRAADFLDSRQGSGSWTRLPPRVRSRVGPLTPGTTSGDVVDLAIAAPAATPEPVLAAFTVAAEALPGELVRPGGVGEHGYHPAGLPVLREAVAARFTARGLPTRPAQILVTSGGQGAIHLLLDHLVDPRDLVLLEQPTYPNAIDALRRTRARLVSVPVTGDGWDVDGLLESIAQLRPRLAYLVTDFHNPTGAVLPAAARGRLVEAARRSGTVLVVDETLAELALANGVAAPAPVASYDTGGRVLTVGSMSKSHWGGLRVGWIRGPSRLVTELAVHRSAVDLAGPVVEHLAAAYLLERADAYLSPRRAELARRRDLLLRLLAEHLPSWRAPRPPGGLSLWVTLDRPCSSALAEAADRHGVRLAAGPRFGLDGALERYLRLPFALPADDLERAVHRLAAAHAELADQMPRSLASSPAVA